MSSLKSIRIQRSESQSLPCSLKRVQVADRFFSRLVGLLNKNHLEDDEGLLISPCSSIHTVGMRFAIDLVYLSKENRVLGLCEHVTPYKFRVAPKGTVSVLEVSEGNVKRTGIHLDDILIFD